MSSFFISELIVSFFVTVYPFYPFFVWVLIFLAFPIKLNIYFGVPGPLTVDLSSGIDLLVVSSGPLLGSILGVEPTLKINRTFILISKMHL